MTHASEQDTYIGRAMKRREDRRLLLGVGKFVDDLRPPGCLSVALVRSPHGHARIRRLDVEAARRAPGVLTVVTGDEVGHLGLTSVNRGPIPDMKIPPHPIIAAGVVHATGVPVAAIVAESAPAAEDAATPSPRNPLGAKGLGEAGCIAIPPALVNAAVDALTPFGVTHLDMPLTPEKLWRAMQG
ncbi:MAG: hypothetical protein ACREK6_05410 [Candidatus Rokuibacteriota bacterium]